MTKLLLAHRYALIFSTMGITASAFVHHQRSWSRCLSTRTYWSVHTPLDSDLLGTTGSSPFLTSLLAGDPSTFTALTDAQSASWTTASDSFALTPTQTVLVFLVGIVPFAVATFEFWRRIAFGESFGTGSDSVVIIGEDDAPASSRGQRVLGKDALLAAYVLFTVAAGVLGLVIFAVVTSGGPFVGDGDVDAFGM